MLRVVPFPELTVDAEQLRGANVEPAALETREDLAREPAPDRGPADERLHRPQFGLHRLDWGDDGVEFHLGHGEWIDVLRANELEIERLLELQASPSSELHRYYDYVTPEWARQWPSEEIWVARRR